MWCASIFWGSSIKPVIVCPSILGGRLLGRPESPTVKRVYGRNRVLGVRYGRCSSPRCAKGLGETLPSREMPDTTKAGRRTSVFGTVRSGWSPSVV